MATGAFSAERLVVGIIALVAIDTLGRGVAVLVGGLMAGVALCFPMFACQHEVGEIVIEGGFIELHDVGIATFVIGVAFGAVQVSGTRVSTVVSALRIDVRRDVFMAVETKCTLVGLLERQVT